MSKPANKTMIGAFVVGAVVLAVTAVVLFGSGKFFRKTEPWLTFFQGSVKGLNVGSPVVFRGVQIGQVTDIIVGFDPTQLEVLIPVFFEIDPEKFKDIGRRVETSDADMHKALISRGLRAQLQIQSLVTGQLLINIDFYPDTPAQLIGIDQFRDKMPLEDWWEIPSVSTPLQELEKALSEINIKEITDDVRRAMDGIAKLATDPDLHEGIGVLKNTLTDIQKLARHLDSKVDPLATSLDQTLDEARAGIGDARKMMNEQAPALVSKIKNAAESATTALEQANTTLKSIEDLADEGTQLRHEVSAALTEISAASRSVRVLSDFIEQHPDAILRGRAKETGGN
ncbi:MAG: MlaD family protein [Desulfobacterales bacterium]|jgi:paraquat-inducible protein B|nr:MlaD family protein [Desulfobacterales bacterium]